MEARKPYLFPKTEIFGKRLIRGALTEDRGQVNSKPLIKSADLVIVSL